MQIYKILYNANVDERFGTKVVHLGQKRRIREKRDWSFTGLRSSCGARNPIFTVKLQHGMQLMTNIRIVSCFGLFSGVSQPHRLRGSASPVLTATHHSYGSPKLSDFFSGSRLEVRPPNRFWLKMALTTCIHARMCHLQYKSQLFIPPNLQGP